VAFLYGCGSLFFFLWSLLLFFGHDILWEWNVNSKKREGINPETLMRTPEWELQQIWTGCYFLVLSLLGLFMMFNS
jgi:hypothetical protein